MNKIKNKMDLIKETISKKMIPKGFLSSNDRPTQKAIEMFFVYLSNLPENWDLKKINKEAVSCVQSFYGVDYGFGVMIQWGISIGCAKSTTSKGRYKAMSIAFTIALGMLGQGVILTDKIIKEETI